MARKRKAPKQAEYPAGEPAALAPTLDEIAEKHGLKSGDRILRPLDPPEIPLEKLPRLGPKKRDIEEPRTIYKGKHIHVTLDGGDTLNIEATQPLTGDQANLAIAGGFDDISGDGKHWQASKEVHAGTSKDINAMAIILDGKGARIGHGRDR